jgi:hypothetical protein
VLNAWISYEIAYETFIVLAISCPYDQAEAKVHRIWCTGDYTQTMQAYYYSLFLNPAKFAYLVLATEATINLAYYKDIIFGLVVGVEFGGMYFFSI